MNDNVTISICIPAYKNVTFLRRLLDSIVIQSYKDYEVIVSDDSPDESVAEFIKGYTGIARLKFNRNAVSLGTPENWNECIRNASGKWIKIMHDDDWFIDSDSLSEFHAAIAAHPETGLIYSSYITVNAATNFQKLKAAPSWRRRVLASNPATLISSNIIGPPSAVIYKADSQFYFDKNLKWLVDIDFYYRYLNSYSTYYIDKPLVNIGMNEFQVTQQSSMVREVEIPEYFTFFNKAGYINLRNILVYDAWWRLFRNLKISSVQDIYDAGYKGSCPEILKRIIRFQTLFPSGLLSIGIASKILMFIHYTLHRSILR